MEWILILGGLYFLSRYNTSGVKVGAGMLYFHKFSGGKIVLRIDAIVTNYTNMAINVSSFAGEMYENGQVIAPLSLVNGGTIAPNTSQNLQLEINVPVNTILAFLQKISDWVMVGKAAPSFLINGVLAYNDSSNEVQKVTVREAVNIDMLKWKGYIIQIIELIKTGV